MELTSEIEKNISAALEEDLGPGDLSAMLVDPGARAAATLITRENMVLCGIPWFEAVFRRLDAGVLFEWTCKDGEHVAKNKALCKINGNARALLTAERPALNFLQTLSATATLTRRFTQAVKNSKVLVMDTRKTLPGLRAAQKYAVRVGGGENLRMGLFDGVLIKENHIAAAGGVRSALRRAQEVAPKDMPIEIEVENLEQLNEALEAGAKLILLDNFPIEALYVAVTINDGRAALEASGGVTLENIRAIADTGVDRISVGSLTKDVKAIDLSLRFEIT